MQPSIHIAQPDAFVTDRETIADAVARSACNLVGAEVRYWHTQPWSVLEQSYDLPDIYLCYIEVAAATDAVIPIHCPYHDLYWLYLLQGGVRISTVDGQHPVLHTTALHYRLTYLPAASYTCHFEAGTHRLFYAVYKSKTLFREDSKELTRGIAPIDAVKNLLGTPSVSRSLSMGDGSADAIHAFLHSPGSSYLRRLLSITSLAVTLISLACEALHISRAIEAVGTDQAIRMQQYINNWVAEGQPVDVKRVAAHCRVSYAYTKAVFKAHHRVAIGNYITDSKLKQAEYLLAAGETPAAVARYICWTYAHFSKVFKTRYKVSPSEYRKQGLRTSPRQ